MVASLVIEKARARPVGKPLCGQTTYGQGTTRHIGRAALIGSLLALAGCAGGTGVEVPSTWRSVPAETAFVIPSPGGPAIVGVMERRYSNATQQDIALATTSRLPGQNLLRVQFFGPVNTAAAGSTSISDTSLAATNISSEMRSQLPGVPMRRSAYYVQNRYGPFGYAVGSAKDSDLCIYAWQRIRPVGRQTTLISNRGTVQLRLRLCQTGANEQQLLAFMYGFSIAGSFSDQSWNPYGAPASPPETLGRPGAPIFPTVPASAGAVAVEPAAQTTAPVPVRRPVRKAVAATSEPLPAPVGPIVPPPPGAAPEASGALVPSPPCSTQSGGHDDACK